MTALFLGALSFPICALSDWLGLRGKRRSASALFALGCLLLAASSVALFRDNYPGHLTLLRVLLLLGAAGALALEFYTLFFALPFSDTYAGDGGLSVVDTGVYALCRHPGVLWLALMYLLAAAALGGAQLWTAALLYTALDMAYVWWQDRFIFPHTLAGYGAYQKRTPFLLPTRDSIRACFRSK